VRRPHGRFRPSGPCQPVAAGGRRVTRRLPAGSACMWTWSDWELTPEMVAHSV
jgi:hypothetical protein